MLSYLKQCGTLDVLNQVASMNFTRSIYYVIQFTTSMLAEHFKYIAYRCLILGIGATKKDRCEFPHEPKV